MVECTAAFKMFLRLWDEFSLAWRDHLQNLEEPAVPGAHINKTSDTFGDFLIDCEAS